MTALLIFLQVIFIPALSPAVVGVIRKIKARLQNRVGASIFQPYRDIIKLFGKDEVISKDASWVFSAAPYIVFATTIVAALGAPLLSFLLPPSPLGDMLTIICTLTLGTFFLALAGMDTGSAFGGFGSSREMTLVALTEGALIFSLLPLAFAAHSNNVSLIAENLSLAPVVALAPLILAFGAYIIALLSENARFPFDNPATHLELTMIHEAMILEYSGKRLALMEWAAANKLTLFLVLGGNLFFPATLATEAGLLPLAMSIVATLCKVLLLAGGIAFLESIIAKFRFFRLPDVLFTSIILSVITLTIML